jgi:hypothetical protein
VVGAGVEFVYRTLPYQASRQHQTRGPTEHGPMDHGRDDLHTRFGCYVLQRIHLLLPKERIHVFAALWQRSNVGTEKTNRDRTCGCDAVCVRYLFNRSTVVRVYGPGDRCWDKPCFKLWMENFIDRVGVFISLDQGNSWTPLPTPHRYQLKRGTNHPRPL